MRLLPPNEDPGPYEGSGGGEEGVGGMQKGVGGALKSYVDIGR